MNVECPVCHVIGNLETRKNSSRIVHYKGFINGKRIYEKHTVKGINLDANGYKSGINGNKSLGIKRVDNLLVLENKAGPMGFEPMTFSLEG
jgi:hypothetical protein